VAIWEWRLSEVEEIMTISLRAGFLAAFALLLFAGAADAGTIDYIFTGTCSSGCSLNGTPFTTFTVTEVGNTAAIGPISGGEYSNPTTGTFVSGGLMATLTGTTNEVIDLTTTPFTIGFGQITFIPPSTLFVSDEAIANSGVFDTYNLATALSLTTGTVQTPTATDYFVTGDTTVGTLDFGTINSLSFQAVTPPAGVPEPITLSIFGAGLVGAAAMRRRKKSKQD
jgi:hypothetical protein